MIARMWLDRCMKTHTLCQPPAMPDLSTTPTTGFRQLRPENPRPERFRELPTRVLDVRALDTPSGIRLVDGAGRFGSYVTLSHVWGQLHIIITKKATIQDRRTCIKIEDLSNTFRDAVEITRQIGVSYLWIDSLCMSFRPRRFKSNSNYDSRHYPR